MPTKPQLSILPSDGFGRVFNEQNQINVKFIEFNVPFTSTAGNVSLNTGGATRIIMLQGANSGDGYAGATNDAKLKKFITTMEDWVNQGTQAKATYTDSFTTTYNVYAVDWTWRRSFADPFRILWTLIIKQGV